MTSECRRVMVAEQASNESLSNLVGEPQIVEKLRGLFSH